MKLLIPFLLISSISFAQPYLSIGGTTRGSNFGAGAIAGGIDINVSYDRPLMRNDKPALLSFSIGKKVALSDEDESHWSITGAVGYGSITYKDYSLYDDGYDKVISVSEFKPVYIAEIGYNAHLGRISFVTKRCDVMYYGLSMRISFYK